MKATSNQASAINFWFVAVPLRYEGLGDNRFSFYTKGMCFYHLQSWNLSEMLLVGMIKGDNECWNSYN